MAYQISAILILLVFYSCYFGKMLAQKKKGIQTDQIGKGKTGFVKAVELTMKVATLAVPVAEIISIVLNTSKFPTWIRMTGILIAALGDLVFILAVITMRDSWRAGVSKTDETKLVTDGIYQISRNPAFLGFDLVYLGIVLIFFNWLLLLLSVFAVQMFQLQIVYVEEDFLLKTFGEDYLAYQKKVNRYLGRKPA